MRPRIMVACVVPPAVLALLREVGDVETGGDPGRGMTRAELLEAARRNEYLYTSSGSPIDAEVMDANPGIKVIAQMAVGFDNIDVAAATARGILVTNTPGVLTETTADTAWALLMAVARRIAEADRFMRAEPPKPWTPQRLMGADVFGKTLGIIGFGRIGRAMARRARGFDLEVIYHDIVRASSEEEGRLGVAFHPLDSLLRKADFVTVHTPYSPATHHLIDERALGLMKKTAFLVNAARGPIVDEKALVKALQTGQIAGAGLDVYEREPLVEPELKAMDNVVLLPHIGSASAATRLAMGLLAAENLIAVMEGRRPPSLVNPEVWTGR